MSQLGQGDLLLVCEGIARRQAGHSWFCDEVLYFDACRYRWAEKDDVDLLLDQSIDVVDEIEAAYLDVYLGVPVVQQAQYGACVRHGGFGADTADDEPAGEPARLGFSVPTQPVHGRDRGTRVRQQYLPRRGEGDGPACPGEQLQAEAPFQVLDLLAECRLGEEQASGSSREVELLGQGDEET